MYLKDIAKRTDSTQKIIRIVVVLVNVSALVGGLSCRSN